MLNFFFFFFFYKMFTISVICIALRADMPRFVDDYNILSAPPVNANNADVAAVVQ